MMRRPNKPQILRVRNYFARGNDELTSPAPLYNAWQGTTFANCNFISYSISLVKQVDIGLQSCVPGQTNRSSYLHSNSTKYGINLELTSFSGSRNPTDIWRPGESWWRAWDQTYTEKENIGENHRINVPIVSVRLLCLVFLLWVIMDASMSWLVMTTWHSRKMMCDY